MFHLFSSNKLELLLFFLFLFVLPCLQAQAGINIPFTVNTSEAMNVVTTGGTPRIAIDVAGVTRYASYASGSGTSALTFTYAATTGDLDLYGIAVSSPIDLNGGALTDLNGNPISDLTFAVPNTSGIKINYPSLSLDFTADADGRYTMNGTAYNDLPAFLTAAGGTFARASTATYFDSTGTMQTASANEPRFDHDPVTNQPKGILIEDTRTNLLERSQEFDNGAWSKGSGTTVTANAIAAPDGTMTADFIAATGSGLTNIGQSYSFSAGSTVSRTIYAKAGTASMLFIEHSDPNGTYCTTKVNVSIGNINYTCPGVEATILPISNGWYRITWVKTFTNASTNAQGAYFYIDAYGAGGAGNGMYLWGAQAEISAFPTSYIPTAGSTVTRAVDSLTMPTGAWFDATKGTMAVSGDRPFLGSSWPGFASIDDGTGSNAVHLFILDGSTDKKGAEIFSGGAYQYSTSGDVYTAGSEAKMALSWEANNARSAMNGTLNYLDTSVNVPVVNTLRIGAGRGGASGFILNGHVASFKYYPVRTSDSQLQLITQ